jgi:hypothetical protein
MSYASADIVYLELYKFPQVFMSCAIAGTALVIPLLEFLI